VTGVAKKLLAILEYKGHPPDDDDALLARINAIHAAKCETDEWQKEGGRFAKSLPNYLNPEDEQYEIEPDDSQPERIVI